MAVVLDTQNEIQNGNDMSGEMEMDFAAMLDEYDYDMPYRGQILEGVVLEASEDEILIDVGLKRDAVVTRKDLSLLDERTKANIKVGQEITTYVLQPRNQEGDLIVSINKAFELEDWQSAQTAHENGDVVEAKVVGMNKGGLLVDYGRLTGFVPQSHIMSLPRFASQYELEDAKRQLIGNNLSLKFIEINRRRNRLIMSERLALAQLQQTRLSELEEGQIITGRVVSIVDFGAFVDLGGVDGLIHISKLAHTHVNHPGEILSIGDKVEVLIDSIDVEKERISLDRTAVIPDPWDSVLETYSVNQLVEGKVTNVVDFGVFVQLSNGLQGLVHLSEMSMFGTGNPRDLFSEGDVVLARITDIDPQQRRIGLSIDRVTVDEQEDWMHNRREQTLAGAFEAADSDSDGDADSESDKESDDDQTAETTNETADSAETVEA